MVVVVCTCSLYVTRGEFRIFTQDLQALWGDTLAC